MRGRRGAVPGIPSVCEKAFGYFSCLVIFSVWLLFLFGYLGLRRSRWRLMLWPLMLSGFYARVTCLLVLSFIDDCRRREKKGIRVVEMGGCLVY